MNQRFKQKKINDNGVNLDIILELKIKDIEAQQKIKQF